MVTFNVKTIKSDRIENKILKWEMVPSFHKKVGAEVQKFIQILRISHF